MPAKNIVSWGVQSVRSVLFTNTFDSARVDQSYFQAFGHQPSGYQGAPPGMPYAASQATGMEKHGQLAVQKSQGRVDIVLTPNPILHQMGKEIPTIEDVNGALDVVQRAAESMSKGSDLSRIAIVGEFAKSFDTAALANDQISKIIPIDLALNDEIDFIFQFTKQSDLSSANVKINFLNRWAVAQVQQFVVPQLSLANVTTLQASGVPGTPISSFYISLVVLDVNTVAQGAPVANEKVRDILREFRRKIDAFRRGEQEG